MKEAEILVVRSDTRVNRQLISKLPNLKLVISPTHGKDHICKKALTERKIAYRTASVQSYDVAQAVMAYIFAFATNMIIADRLIKKGIWNRKELIGFRVKGKTLGIIGFGRTGKEVAKLALANGLKVIVYDKYVSSKTKWARALTFVKSLEELLMKSDIVTIHVPLSGETRHLIGERELKLIKDKAYLINTARGEILDEKAVLKALEEGKLAGVALDIFNHRSSSLKTSYRKLAHHRMVIASPHSIAQTKEVLRKKGEVTLKIIKEYYIKKYSDQIFKLCS
jgi:D-3-phosphoglycerate dehydrogenase